MGDIRKLNGGMVKCVETMNIDTTDEEVSALLGMTIGEAINGINKFPAMLRQLTVEDLFDCMLANDDSIGETLLEKLSLNPDDPNAEEKMEALGKELEEFCKAMGIG